MPQRPTEEGDTATRASTTSPLGSGPTPGTEMVGLRRGMSKAVPAPLGSLALGLDYHFETSCESCTFFATKLLFPRSRWSRRAYAPGRRHAEPWYAGEY